jgi:hypothetical protein
LRRLKRGQVYTSHDGSGLYRIIESVHEKRPIWEDSDDPTGVAPWKLTGYVDLVYYRTNRSPFLHRCLRSTFIDWIRVRKARKTQKYRRRQIMGSP